MTASLSSGITDAILAEVQGPFTDFCAERYQKQEFAQIILQTMRRVDEGRMIVLDGIVQRMKEADSAQLESYVLRCFQIPLGIKLKLLSILQSLGGILLDCNTRGETIDFHRARSEVHELWDEWKAGRLNNLEYFQILNDMAFNHIIDVDCLVEASNRALMEGGLLTPSEDLVRPNAMLYAEVRAFHLDAIINAHPSSNGNSISIGTISKASVTVEMEEGNTDLIMRSIEQHGFHPTRTSPETRWLYMAGQTNLRLVDGGLIIVGDTLDCGSGRLEIDQVLCLDARCQSNNNDVIDTILVIEGRWIFTRGSEDVVLGVDRMNDGVTEIARQDTSNNSPNGTGLEDNNHIVPDYSFQTQMYLIAARSDHRHTTIKCIKNMSKQLAADQRPVGIFFAHSNYAFIFGLGGLLMQVSFEDYGSGAKEHSDSYDAEEGFGSVSAISLTEDTLKVDFEDHVCVSHRTESVVHLAVYQSASQTLYTADNQGCVCRWNTPPSGDRCQLSAVPFHCCSRKDRPYSLHALQYGEGVIVGMRDRLVLLALNDTTTVDDIDVLGLPNLYEKAVLDTLAGCEAIYTCSFTPGGMYIWRLTAMPRPEDSNLPFVSRLRRRIDADNNQLAINTRSGILITVWKHRLPDRHDNTFHPLPTMTAMDEEGTFSLDAADLEKELCSEMDHGRSPNDMEEDLPTHGNRMASSLIDFSSMGMELQPPQPPINRPFSPLVPLTDGNVFVTIGNEHIPLLNDVAIMQTLSTSTVDMFLATEAAALLEGGTAMDQAVNLPLNQLTAQTYLDPELVQEHWIAHASVAKALFSHDHTSTFTKVYTLLSILGACFQPPSVHFIAAATESSVDQVTSLINDTLGTILQIQMAENKQIVTVRAECKGFVKWLCSQDNERIGKSFWIDVSGGHNLICALYLRCCGNKSIAVEHSWQSYLQTYGPSHLRRSSRGLRKLTTQIRKIDETANIKLFLPCQIGYISGLQEIYARRVGLGGPIPREIGELAELRVLSMGNNRLTGQLPESLGHLKHLQRIVLHQNNLFGEVPHLLGELGCIVNLAGNPRLEYGPDVPPSERSALVELFLATQGSEWNNRSNWGSTKPVAKWYKVGVLSSHVHSIVMSSNGMVGCLPPGIAKLGQLRMIELATMPGLTGSLPKELCHITTLRRLCICRCALTGPIPEAIGHLIGLEELQLFGNKINGKIPASVGNLVNLKLLSLGEYTGGNDFTSDVFPASIERLVNLEALFLANCNIKGPIPAWIGSLRELRQLDLQRNNITGSIPRSIGQLENLLYLNIKDNAYLGGRVPVQELAALTRLNRLSMVHCNFSDKEAALTTLRASLPRCKIWI